MEKKKVIVTCGWPYGSNVPHLGNFVGAVLSGDILAKYYRMRGHECVYVSGTDAHGASIEYEAEKKGVAPEELVKETHQKILDILDGFNICFDNYTTTTSKNHKDFIKNIYLKMEKNGFIFSKDEEKMFCNTCEKFLADRFVLGTCPKCNFELAKGNQCDSCSQLLEPEELKNPKCEICKKENLALKKTKHWYLDFKKLKPELEEYILSHKEWKGNVKNFSLNLIKNIKPRAVTRDLKWGIDAPFEGAEGKKIYVWMEAALGYVSATKENVNNWKDFWFGDQVKQVYCIGKDNIPFHTMIFPGQLIASGDGYHLPDQMAATEYLNWIGGSKFSKSRGVGIFCDDALKILPSTYWRFYLSYTRPENKDTNFSWEELEKTSNQILVGDYVNLVNRVVTLTQKYFGGKVKSNIELTDEDEKVLESVSEVEKRYTKLMEDGLISQALKEVMSLSSLGNAYLQKKEPWKNEKYRESCLYVCSNLIKDITILLYPFTPKLSLDILKIFNVPFHIPEKPDIKSEKEYGKHIGARYGYLCKKSKNILDKIDLESVKNKYESLKKEDNKMVDFSDFEKIDLRVGVVKKVESVEGANKLYKLTVDIGEERVLLAGLKPYYTEEKLNNRRVIVVANLKPKKMRGIESNGMVLAAEDTKGNVSLLEPDKDLDVGSKVR